MAQEDKNKKIVSDPSTQKEKQAYWRRHLDSSVVDLRNSPARKEEKKPIETSIKTEQKETEDIVNDHDVPKDDGKMVRDIGSYRDAGSGNSKKSFQASPQEGEYQHRFDDNNSFRDHSGDRDMPVAYLAKEEYVNQYIEELKRHSAKTEKKEMDDERIKEELFAQLSSIDSQDLKIQEQFPKASPRKQPKAASAYVQNAPSRAAPAPQGDAASDSGSSKTGVSRTFQLIPRDSSGGASGASQRKRSFAKRPIKDTSGQDDLELDNFIHEDGTTEKDKERHDDTDKGPDSGDVSENSNTGAAEKTKKRNLFKIRNKKRSLRKERKKILEETPKDKPPKNTEEDKKNESVQALHASMQKKESPVLFGEVLARFAENNEIEVEERIPSRYKDKNSEEKKGEEETKAQDKSSSRFLSRIQEEGLQPDTREEAKRDDAFAPDTPTESGAGKEYATPEEEPKETAESENEEPLVLDFSHTHGGEEADSSTDKSSLFQKKRNKHKKIILAVLLACLVVVPSVVFGKLVSIKNESQISAERAYAYMKEGQEALFSFDSEKAEESFFLAMNEFSDLEKNFTLAGGDILSIAAKFPVQTSASSNARLVYAGSLISEAGYEASVMLNSFQDVSPTNDKEDAAKLTDTLITASARVKNINELMSKANKNLSYVRPEDVPQEFREELLAAQNHAGTIEEYSEETLSHLDTLLVLLGHAEPKNYFLAFQNSSELRPTGGFIGTYGLVRLQKGSMEELFIDGIYNPDGQLTENDILIVPPAPLQHATPNLGTRDANWFLDFPKSAEKVIDIYKKTGGPPSGETDNFDKEDFDIHGVIALNINMLTRLLELSGPIEMPEYGVTLNSENWLPLVQQEVEEDYDKELNRPKQILADMSPLLMEKLSENENKMELINIVLEGLEQKDILVYSRDSDVQDVVLSRNWGGAMPNTASRGESESGVMEDYLGVAISNIGGMKTDLYTDTEIDTTTEFTKDGEIIRKVIIARRHNGGNTSYDWYNETNRGYIKFYVPHGSELISAEGFSSELQRAQVDHEKEGYTEDPDIAAINSTLRTGDNDTDIFEENNHTVFGNWLSVQPQDRGIASIAYKLPYNTKEQFDKYRLYIQKQSGLEATYSGSVESSHPELSVRPCSVAEESSQSRQFGFVQLNDEEIKCRLDY